MYTIIFSRDALKSLSKIPSIYQLKIKQLTPKLAANPFGLDIKKLTDMKVTHRIRMGDYRIFLKIDPVSKQITIADIRRRTTQTYR